MNQSVKSNQTSSYIKEIFLLKIGSTWLIDGLYLFLIVPLSCLGTLFNIISLIIFFRSDLRSIKIFQYFQVYTMNSLIQSGTLIFAFYQSPRYLFELSVSYSARFFRCKIVGSYVVALLFFYGNALGILLNLERASHFSVRLRRFKNLSPYLACLILLAICSVFNLPTYFMLNVASDEEVAASLLSLEGVLKFQGLCTRTQVSLSTLGKAITLFGYSVKGILTLCMDMATNLLSIHLLRKYFRSRNLNLTLQQTPQDRQQSRLNSSKVNQTYMTIYLTACSIFLHVIEFLVDLCFTLFPTSEILITLAFAIYFLIAIKQLINFFFYAAFNRRFWKYLIQLVKFEFNSNSFNNFTTSVNRSS